MMHLLETVLIITNNPTYKEPIRLLFSQYKNFHLILSHSIQQALPYIQEHRLKLILLDEQVLLYNPDLAQEFLKKLISLTLNLNSILIVDQIERDIFSKYIKLGFTYITDIRIAQYMIPAVLDYLSEFNNKQPIENKIIYKGLTIFPNSGYICLKNCKIFLSQKHTDILMFIIEKDGKCNIGDLQKHIEIEAQKEIASSYITVCISRLNKQIYNATGLKIIKNRYGVGYYLVL